MDQERLIKITCEGGTILSFLYENDTLTIRKNNYQHVANLSDNNIIDLIEFLETLI